VQAWAAGGYRGVTPTTRTLLNYWFRADHRLPNGEKSQCYPFQRAAIETLIYLYEVAKVRRHKQMNVIVFERLKTDFGGGRIVSVLMLREGWDVQGVTGVVGLRPYTIPYTDSAANLRYYEPDFVAVTTDGTHHLIETKGREDIDVKHKDRAAQLWRENASQLTGMAWAYQIVHQQEFAQLRPDEFSDLVALAPIEV
jgi:hypothetical protein